MLESLRSVVISDDDSVTVTMNNDASTTLVFPNVSEVIDFANDLVDQVQRVQYKRTGNVDDLDLTS